MRSFLIALTSILFTAVQARSESTPLSEPLPEEKEMTITCEEVKPEPAGSVGAAFAQKPIGTYHYKLWLPKGYLADTKKRWPCMFIAMPGGNANFGQMGTALKAANFVVVMLVESKNGPWEPIIGNFAAAHDDVVKRVRIEEGKKYATGFSGGARASSLFVQMRPGFAGLICQGAGFASGKNGRYTVSSGLHQNKSFKVAFIVGDGDSNKSEAARMKKEIPTSLKLQVFPWPGNHSPAPADVFEKAFSYVTS